MVVRVEENKIQSHEATLKHLLLLLVGRPLAAFPDGGVLIPLIKKRTRLPRFFFRSSTLEITVCKIRHASTARVFVLPDIRPITRQRS